MQRRQRGANFPGHPERSEAESRAESARRPRAIGGANPVELWKTVLQNRRWLRGISPLSSAPVEMTGFCKSAKREQPQRPREALHLSDDNPTERTRRARNRTCTRGAERA